MKLKGKKISEVSQRFELTGQELLPFAQDGENGSMSIDTIASYAYDKEGGDFTSRLAYDVQVPGVELIADRAEKDAFGNIITNTYVTRSGAKKAMNEAIKEQLPDAIANINDGFVTPNMLSEETKQLFGAETITNFPDNEDIAVNASNQLTLADKEYNPTTYSGMGRKKLRKNMINGVNTLTQNMLNKQNTIYVIQYDFDLNGEEITIPEGCVLDFSGGSFNNGTIVGNNTVIDAESNICIFKSINIQGDWNVPHIYVDWMFIDYTKDNKKEIQSIFGLTNSKIQNIVYFPNKTLLFEPISGLTFDDRCYCTVKSNTDIIIPSNCVIEVLPNYSTNYFVFYCGGVENVNIYGGGTIIGDVENHKYIEDDTTKAQNCCLIALYRVKNCSVQNLTLNKSTGDGLYLGGGAPSSYEDFSQGNTNIVFKNVICDSNRRQGLSVTASTNGLEIINCKFSNTGTIALHQPAAGIDFEPDYVNSTITNVLIENCEFVENVGAQILFANVHSENFNINDCLLKSTIILNDIPYYEYAIRFETLKGFNCNINNCKLLGTLHGVKYSEDIANIYINNSEIKGVSTYDTPTLNGKTHNANFIFNNCTFSLDNENVMAGGMKSAFVFNNNSLGIVIQ